MQIDLSLLAGAKERNDRAIETFKQFDKLDYSSKAQIAALLGKPEDHIAATIIGLTRNQVDLTSLAEALRPVALQWPIPPKLNPTRPF